MTTRTGPAGAAGRPGLVAAGLVNVQLAQHREKLKQDQEPAIIHLLKMEVLLGHLLLSINFQESLFLLLLMILKQTFIMIK